jgi:hypothetical protein
MPYPPLNEYAILGSTVVLVCEVNVLPPVSRVSWFEYVTTGIGQMISDNDNVLPSHPNFPRYRLVKATAYHYYLEISDVRYEDAGTYLCMNSQAGPPNSYRGTAELIVIAPNLACSTPIPANGIVADGQNFTAQCSLDYRGKFNPHIEWSGHPGIISAIVVSETNVFSGIIFTVVRSMDGLAFRASVYFRLIPPQAPDVADNTPTYSNQYTTQTLLVHWGPSSVTATPIKDFYVAGDTIVCDADAFPTPSFTWQNMVSLDLSYGPVFTVTPSMEGKNHSMRCQAQNVIQGFVFSANVFVAVLVPAITTPTTTTTPAPTTPPPAEADCDDLSGWWISQFPPAEIFVQVTTDMSGKVVGYMRNGTDQQWIEAVGRTRVADNAYIGLTVIWPYEIGITGMSGECHKCFGTEVIISSGIWRSISDSAFCGDGGDPSAQAEYTFFRATTRGVPPSLAETLKKNVAY